MREEGAVDCATAGFGTVDSASRTATGTAISSRSDFTGGRRVVGEGAWKENLPSCRSGWSRSGRAASNARPGLPRFSTVPYSRTGGELMIRTPVSREATWGTLLCAAVLAGATTVSAQGKRPMSWVDAQYLRSVGGAEVSPDGRQVLYALSTPDWKEATSQSDIYLVEADRGVASTKQLTFTTAKNESQRAGRRRAAGSCSCPIGSATQAVSSSSSSCGPMEARRVSPCPRWRVHVRVHARRRG